MYRRKTSSFTSSWSISPQAPTAAPTPTSTTPARTTSGRFGLIVTIWDLDFIDMYQLVLDEPVYSDQTKFVCGSREIIDEKSCDFFDGTRMFVRDVPSRQPDESFRPACVYRDLDDDHFEITQPSCGTFVLTCLSEKGTKVNHEIVARGASVVLRHGDIIEDRVVYV